MGEKFSESRDLGLDGMDSKLDLSGIDGELDMGQEKDKRKIDEDISLSRHEFDFRIANTYFKMRNPSDFKEVSANLLATHPLFDVLYNLEANSGINYYESFQSEDINELNFIDWQAKDIEDRSVMEENAIPSILFKYFNETEQEGSSAKQKLSERMGDLESRIMDLNLAVDEIQFQKESLIASDMSPELLQKNLDSLNASKNELLRRITGLSTYLKCVQIIVKDAENLKKMDVFEGVISKIRSEIDANEGEITFDMLNNYRADFKAKREGLISSHPEMQNGDEELNEFFDEIFRFMELMDVKNMSEGDKSDFTENNLYPKLMEFMKKSETLKTLNSLENADEIVSNYRFLMEGELALIGVYFGIDLD